MEIGTRRSDLPDSLELEELVVWVVGDDGSVSSRHHVHTACRALAEDSPEREEAL